MDTELEDTWKAMDAELEDTWKAMGRSQEAQEGVVPGAPAEVVQMQTLE